MAKIVGKIKEGIKAEKEILKSRLKAYGAEIVEADERISKKIKKESAELNKEFRKNMVIAVTAAFAFVIALQWKDVITEGVNYLIAFSHLPQGQALGFKVVSAIAVTFICVLGILLTTRLLKKRQEKSKEDGSKKGK